MKLYKSSTFWIVLIFLTLTSFLSARSVDGHLDTELFKQLDLSRYHTVGNMWLRVSNYGHFGQGSSGLWPSLEYPAGSGIDYVYVGSLWFGAKKERRDAVGNNLYWRNWPPHSDDDMTPDITQAARRPSPLTGELVLAVVVDTLVTVGFDGDASLYEFLPAWNPLEQRTTGFHTNNLLDTVITTSTRMQRRGFDDDGDGVIDEDPVGFNFPFRRLRTVMGGQYVDLPTVFHQFAGRFIHDLGSDGTPIISDNMHIWFPLGFQDLSYVDPNQEFNFARPNDDDNDGLVDEDGAPVSEQDFISYYYDYSPFGTLGERAFGSSATRNNHVPLNVRVRQMSYAWSFDFIKNLIYVEFNITNMNPEDTLFDAAMGVYIDADVGPQSFDADTRSLDDVSGYVKGRGFEFAYSRDFDGDGGLTTGWIGVRVCSPDPDSLEFACWNWKRGDGPDDMRPRFWGFRDNGPPARKTANEKYWLLTNRNPDESKFTRLRPEDHTGLTHFEESTPRDTRFLFAFYGDQEGYDNYILGNPKNYESWNLEPFQTMKIVVALFPGESLEELKETSLWAQDIYGRAQTLTTVILPDTFMHYEPPEPPNFPRLYAELVEPQPNRIHLDVYWDNRSEFSVDYIKVTQSDIGWNNRRGLDSDSTSVRNWNDIPEIFRPDGARGGRVPNATINPFTASRLRHTFQGYSLWHRTGRGELSQWALSQTWDRVDTAVDLADHRVNYGTEVYKDLGGDLGRDTGLPQPAINQSHQADFWDGYYVLNDYYLPVPIVADRNATTCTDDFCSHRGGSCFNLDKVYGTPIYGLVTRQDVWNEAIKPIVVNDNIVALTIEQRQQNQLLFAHPWFLDQNQPSAEQIRRRNIYLAIVDDAMIPLPGHLGQNNVVGAVADMTSIETVESRRIRLARRYYRSTIQDVPRGTELYVSVSAFNRGMPSKKLGTLESGRDANMEIFFPGPLAKPDMNNIYVVPNPYRGRGLFDGRIDGDARGDMSRRIWFVNLPERANVQIFTLAGDLVDEFEHDGRNNTHDIISISKAANREGLFEGRAASGIHPWNLLSKNNQIVASGLYFYSVKCRATGNIKVGRFAIIR